MGRHVQGPNPTNDAQQIFDKLAKDEDRNGSGWLGLMVFDPVERKVRWFTYSPVIDVWATDRVPEKKGTTYPHGEDVVEELDFDFDTRFGPARGAR